MSMTSPPKTLSSSIVIVTVNRQACSPHSVVLWICFWMISDQTNIYQRRQLAVYCQSANFIQYQTWPCHFCQKPFDINGPAFQILGREWFRETSLKQQIANPRQEASNQSLSFKCAKTTKKLQSILSYARRRNTMTFKRGSILELENKLSNILLSKQE